MATPTCPPRHTAPGRAGWRPESGFPREGDRAETGPIRPASTTIRSQLPSRTHRQDLLRPTHPRIHHDMPVGGRLTGQEGTMSDNDVDKIIKAYREALHAFVNGDPEPVTSLFSTRDDVTLANPLCPPQRGRADVENTIRAAAANFHSGSIHLKKCHG